MKILLNELEKVFVKSQSRALKSFALSLCLALVICLDGLSFVSLADVNDLLIATDSDALSYDSGMLATGSNADPYGLMTLELDDYGVAPASSVGTVSNTADSALVCVRYTNGTYNNAAFVTPQLVDNRWDFGFEMPDSMNGYWINEVDFYLQSKTHNFNSLPSPPGNYTFGFDFSSDFSYDLGATKTNLFSAYIPDNADWEYSYVYLTPAFESGDLYVAPTAINVGSGYNNVRLRVYPAKSSNLQNFAGSYSVAFKVTSTQGTELVGDGLSYGDTVQDDMSGSLSDLSSSMDDLSSSMDEQAENTSIIADVIQNLASDIVSGMEPHYDNVLTQLHHITEQLHAFWDQLYNMFYLPQYARLGEILDAIRDMETGLGGVVSDGSSAIIGKLQSVQDAIETAIDESTDVIIHGFDNSEMQEYNDAFSSVLEQENAIQQDIYSSMTGFNDLITEDTQPLFDFSVLPFGVGTALASVGFLMNLLFLAMGPFGQIALCGLTLSAFLILIGFYRVRV